MRQTNVVFRKAILIFFVGVGSVVLAACSQSSGEVSGSGVTVQNSNAPDIRSIGIEMKPSSDVMRTGAQVQFSAVPYGSNGQRMEIESPFRWQFQPSDAVEPVEGAEKDNGYKLVEEATVQVSACAKAKRGEKCGQRTVVVDDGPPSIEITAPKPGEILQSSPESSGIEVKGLVSTAEASTVFVNGRSVEVSADGRFRTFVSPEFGVNHIEAVAFDGHYNAASRQKAPKVGRDFVDILWAPSYKPVQSSGGRVSSSHSQGLELRLSQSIFDDGTSLQETSEGSEANQYKFGDIADLVELAIQKLDYGSNISNPVVSNSSIELNLDEINPGEVSVTLDLLDSGAELYVRLPDLAVETSGSAEIEGQMYSLDGTVRASPAAIAQLRIEIDSEQNVNVSMGTVDISLDSMRGNYPSSTVNVVLDVSSGLLRSSLEDAIVNQIRAQIIERVPTMIEDSLQKTEDSLSDQTREFELSSIGETLELAFDGGIDELDTSFRGALLGAFGVSTGLGPIGEEAPSGKGIPQVRSQASNPPLIPSSKIQIGMRLSVVNGLLYKLWRAGFFDLSLKEAGILPSGLSASLKEAKLVAKLPPVIAPPRPTADHDLSLRLGQMQLRLEQQAGGRADTYAFYLEVGINLSLSQDSFGILIPKEPMIESWVESTTKKEALLGNVGSVIKSQVWNSSVGSGDKSLKKRLTSGLSFELPIPNPGDSLSTVSPVFSDLTVDLSPRRPLVVERGWLVFDRTFSGTF